MLKIDDVTHNVDAERALIGSVLLDPYSIDSLSPKIYPDDFYVQRNKKIWETIQQLQKSSTQIDFITLSGALRSIGLLKEIGGEPYLTELAYSCPNSVNVDAYAKLVRESSFNRKAVLFASTIAQNAFEGKSPMASIKQIDKFITDSQKGYSDDKRIIMTAKELCSVDFPEVSWIVTNWIMKGGINIIAGMPAAGKTFLALDLALGISNGSCVWGNYRVPKERILYHYLDGSLRGMHTRVTKLLAGRQCEKPESLLFDFSPFNLRSSNDIVSLKHRIKKEKISVVIFDVFAKFIPGADENSVSDISPVMNSLREISNRLGTSFILLHHLNKGSSNDYSYRIRGSSEILGSVDSALIVTQENAANREIIPQKIREAELPKPMKFRIVSTSDSTSFEFSDSEYKENIEIHGHCKKIYQEIITFLNRNTEVWFSRNELITPQIISVESSSRTVGRAFDLLKRNTNIQIKKEGTKNFYRWIESNPTKPLV